MKQPDRFEMMPDKVGILQEDDAFLHKAVLGLLRRQHAAYVRLVRRQRVSLGRFVDRDVLLAAFTQYRQGARR